MPIILKGPKKNESNNLNTEKLKYPITG